MLAIVQFPIADFRPFLPQLGGKLTSPTWPPKVDFPNEFLRTFGPAVPRHRGVDWAWTDERSFFRANRALRFKRLPEDSNGWQSRVRCAFRRILSDGEAVTRFEVGLSYTNDQDSFLRKIIADLSRNKAYRVVKSKSCVIGASPLEMGKYIASLKTAVPLFGDEGKFRPLIQQGRAISKLYLTATSDLAKPVESMAWHQLIGVGAPIIFVEGETTSSFNLPKNFVKIDPSRVGQANLAYGRVQTQWGSLSLWVLSHGKASTVDIRNLRLCLLRLHAEQEVLNSVLGRINNGSLPYNPHDECSDKLEAYLNRATRLIDRNCWAGIDQSAILQSLDAAESMEYKVVRKDLFKRLEGIRRQIRIKLERFESRSFPSADRHIYLHDQSTYIEQVETMDTKKIEIGKGAIINAPVTVADHIENSFNAIDKTKVDSQLLALIQQLLQQISKVAESSPEASSVMAGDAEVLAKEITKETPRRKWYELSLEGIKNTAKELGDVGKPIIETTAKLLPLLVALFPQQS